MKKIMIFSVLVLVMETVYVVHGAITLSNESNSFKNNFDSTPIDDDYFPEFSFEDDLLDDRFDIDFSQEQPYIDDEELQKGAEFKQVLKFFSIEKMVSSAASGDIPDNVADKVRSILENATEYMIDYDSRLTEPIASVVYMIDNPQHMKNLDEAYKEAARSNDEYNPKDDYVTVDQFLSAVRENYGLPENRHLFEDLDDGFDDDLETDPSYPAAVQQQLLVVNELEKLAEYLPLPYTVYGASLDLPEEFRRNLLEKLDFIKQRLQILRSPLINAANFQNFVLTHPELMRKIVRVFADYDEGAIVNLTVDEFFDILRQHMTQPTQNPTQNAMPSIVAQMPPTQKAAARITNPYQHVPPLIGVMNAIPTTAATTNFNVDALTSTAQAKGATGGTNRFSLSGSNQADLGTANVMRMGEMRKNEFENSTETPQNGIETTSENGLGARQPSIEGTQKTPDQPTTMRKWEQSNGLTNRKSQTLTTNAGPSAAGSSPTDTETAETSLDGYKSDDQPPSDNNNSKSNDKMDSLTQFGTNAVSFNKKSSGPL